jgi:hypothetical protein
MCITLQNDYDDFGFCIGVPQTGAPCDDGNVCTWNDKCEAVTTDEGFVRGVCVGEFDANIPCSDFDDFCTINDRCGFSFTLLVQ